MKTVEDDKKQTANSEYLLDVAKSSSYQNQSEEYYQAFGKWRSRKNNRYGYAYVKDIRERTYMEGKGYLADGPDRAERHSLLNCFNLMGAMMVIMQALTFAQMMIMPYIGGTSNISLYFYSFENQLADVSLGLACFISLMNIMKLLIPLVIYFSMTRMPAVVAIPRANVRKPEITISGVAFMMMASVFGRFGNYFLSKLFALVNIDISGFNVISSSDPRASAVYFISECILVSALTELLFRGAILQTFRQYGDFFALMVTCLLEVLSFGDITMSGYIFLSSAVIGLFTLRSGSVFTAIIMRISARLVNFAASNWTSLAGDTYQLLVEAVVSVLVIGFALFTYSRLLSDKNCDFNITDSYTHLNTKSKLLIMLSSKELVVWIVMVFITMIFNIRFIE